MSALVKAVNYMHLLFFSHGIPNLFMIVFNMQKHVFCVSHQEKPALKACRYLRSFKEVQEVYSASMKSY